MEHTAYSITFTGNFLQPLPREAQRAQLRNLFPQATDIELLEFFKGRRLLLTHTDSEIRARELVSVMATHGLECEFASDAVGSPQTREEAENARPKPHVKLASHLVSGVAPAAPPAPTASDTAKPQDRPPAMPVIDEDALTPRGRRLVTLAAIAVGSLSVYAIWSSAHSTYGHTEIPDNGEMIPSLCALHESTGWFSGHGTYSLACSTSNEDGRYKLLMSCTSPEDFAARLAFYDSNGSPRTMAEHAATGDLPTQYRLSDGSGHSFKLRTTDKSHIEAIDGLSGTAAGALLTQPSAGFSGISDAGPVTFQFEPARWYVNAFIFSCRLAKAPH